MTMTDERRKELEARGFKFTNIGELFDLSEAEVEMIEVRISLAIKLRKLRERKRLTQRDLAAALGTSQARISMMETGDPGVAIEQIIRALLTVGASRRMIGRAIAA